MISGFGSHWLERRELTRDQVAVCTVQFDPVEARIQRQLRGPRIFLDGVVEVGLGHRSRRTVRLHAQRIREHLAWGHGHAGPEHLGAGRQVGDMRHPAAVHQQHEDFAALGVDRSRHSFPSIHLGLVVQAGDARIAEAVGAG